MSDRHTDFRSRLYDSYVTTHLAEQDIDKIEHSLIHALYPHLPPRDSRARVLDIGAGSGILVARLCRDGYLAYGIDMSPEQVEVARARGITNIGCISIEDYFKSDSSHWDVITAIDVLEHFDKDAVLPLLDHLRARLAPGGVLIFRVPNGESPFSGRYLYSDFTHGTIFTARSASQVLKATGFASVQAFSVEPPPYGILSTLRRYLWKVLQVGIKGVLAVETGMWRSTIVTQNMLVVARK